VSVSSSTQLLGLLNNVAPTSGGTITITPAAANVVPAVATVVQQNTAGVVNATSTLPISNGPASNVSGTVLTTVGSLPTNATSGIVPSQDATTGQLSLRGGH
ncbi:MAG TPA: hypothetical protein VN860_01965, partial [Candidatus Acidoferrales bacterium]|nr:hypothetical protein [Candidatus Acidoferrales bacterium]